MKFKFKKKKNIKTIFEGEKIKKKFTKFNFKKV